MQIMYIRYSVRTVASTGWGRNFAAKLSMTQKTIKTEALTISYELDCMDNLSGSQIHLVGIHMASIF